MRPTLEESRRLEAGQFLTMNMVMFTSNGKRFAVKEFDIRGLEDAEVGSVLLVQFWEECRRIPIDEDFNTAFNRINDLDDWSDKALKEDE